MPERVNKIIDPIKTRWVSLSRPQQYKLVGVISAVIIAIALAAFFIFRTNYIPLAPVRGIIESMQMQQALDEEGISNRLNRNMSMLYVDERRAQDAIRAITLADAAPPEDHFTWANAFDTGLGTTENERFHRARLATAGDIESQFRAVHGIDSASVTLNLANPRPFDRNAPPPSAGVIVRTSRDIPPHEGRNLALIVTRAVNGLELDQVTIIDQHARAIWSEDINAQNDPVSTVQEVRNQHRNHIEMAVNRMFALMFDEVQPSMNFVFGDTLFIEEISNVFTAVDGFDGGIPFEVESRRASMEGVGGGFEPGLAWQGAAVPGYAMGDQGTVSADQRDIFTRYHVNHHETIAQVGPDWVDTERSTAAVVATNWRYVYEGRWMEENEGSTSADWDEFVRASARPTNITAEYPGFDDAFNLLVAATGLSVNNVRLVIYEQIIPVPTIPTPWNIPLFVMLAVLVLLLLMLAYGLLQRQKQDSEEEAEPELSVEDLLVSTQLEEAKEEAAEELDAIEYFKDNEIKKHIEKFVNEKPEAVASLLRNWINIEEW
ncbi:MAG: hypothetical protein FWB91_11145 [Defluviitaleaceae bacterium]|nr:hypothetical protein [Defluviitaleaceae bacterium]